jgi:hypothetical protein
LRINIALLLPAPQAGFIESELGAVLIVNNVLKPA